MEIIGKDISEVERRHCEKSAPVPTRDETFLSFQYEGWFLNEIFKSEMY
jgi:hypothetical protein